MCVLSPHPHPPHTHITGDCVELPAIPNGMISYAPDMMDNYSAGTVATYTCDDGFELVPGVGNSMRTCLPVEQMPDAASRSEFDGAEPSCECKCSGENRSLNNYSFGIQTMSLHVHVRKCMN